MIGYDHEISRNRIDFHVRNLENYNVVHRTVISENLMRYDYLSLRSFDDHIL